MHSNSYYLLLRVKNIILPSMTLLSPPLGPNNPLTQRSSKPSEHTLPSNIDRKLSSFASSLGASLQESPDPSFWSRSLCSLDTSPQVPEIAIQTLELGFNFAFQEAL